MATHPKNQPSFSPGRRWKIGINVVVRTILVLAIVVMVNYLGGFFFGRFYLSSQTRVELSPRTVSILHSLTNHVTVTLYYDKQDDFYPTIVALLNEYHSVNPNISVKTVDFVRDAGEAEKIKERYKLNSPTEKDLVIFECPPAKPSDDIGPFKIANGNALIQYAPGKISKDKKLEFRPVAFRGEMMFTSMLLAVINPKPLKAYFLEAHGEPSLEDTSETGYLKFASILAQNYIQTQPLQLLGDSPVPADCNLLVIAGPRTAFSNLELDKIDRYLSQSGRLLVLLNYASIQEPTGIENILKQWGVSVGADVVQDPKNTTSGQDVIVCNFNQHPVVNPLTRLALQLILPRPVSHVNRQNPPVDAQVDELAFSGSDSVLVGERGETPRSYPLMAAVEQNPVKGVANPRGTMRMVVVGDSFFLGNRQIESGANRDFVGYAVNWLLDRPILLEGIGPRPVTEFRLIMTRVQQRNVRWLLLVALPGSILMLGGLAWLRRRK